MKGGKDGMGREENRKRGREGKEKGREGGR